MSLKRNYLVLIILLLSVCARSQSMFDSPEMYFYEQTYYKDSDRIQKEGSMDGKYFKFLFEYPNNRIALECWANGEAARHNEGYVFVGKQNGYDKYVKYQTRYDYYLGWNTQLINSSYLLVSPKREKIISFFYFDGIYSEQTYEKGDPNHRRSRKQKSPSSGYGNVNPGSSYSAPTQTEKEIRYITCKWCNGTGLLPNESHHSTCYNGCVLSICRTCGKRHCINLTSHSNCHHCEGTGKIKQAKTNYGWVDQW